MIVGLGLDLVEVSRVDAALSRFGLRFLEKFLNEAELRAAPERNIAAYAAARFAAKEAGVKALGTGFAGGVTPHDLEVRRADGGRPELFFHGRAAARCAQLGAARAHLTLSHTKNTAAAVVILES
jgi:holo-[acyl-carrier protein] synthase